MKLHEPGSASEKNKCRRRSDLHGRGIWHNMLVRGRQGKDLKERKLSRHAKTMVPKMKTNPKGKGFMKKGLNLSKISIGARQGSKNGVLNILRRTERRRNAAIGTTRNRAFHKSEKKRGKRIETRA